MKVLIGELLNVLNHYRFSGIPTSLADGGDGDFRELIRRMKFAKYGGFNAADNIALYGFLSAGQVRNIHQLALKIRNTDTLIDLYLSSKYEANNEDTTSKQIGLIREINTRLGYVADTADLVLSYISEQHPEYEALVQETKNMEKPSYGV